MLGGNHGDEYEGQVALNSLARSLKPNQIHGQLIILPMANFPAAQAGLRTSPIDSGNLNRSFPGNPQGSPTEIIAHFIEHTLLAKADHLIDIHSGGSSLYYHPTALLSTPPSPKEQRLRQNILNALGMPKAILYETEVDAGYSSSAAARNKAIGVLLEIGGGGRISSDFLHQLEKALLRYLQHINVLDGTNEQVLTPTRNFRVPSKDYYIHARQEGLFQPEVKIDDQVESGQLAGWIHFPEDVKRNPEKLVFQHPATVIALRVPAKVIAGDCLYETAIEVTS